MLRYRTHSEQAQVDLGSGSSAARSKGMVDNAGFHQEIEPRCVCPGGHSSEPGIVRAGIPARAIRRRWLRANIRSHHTLYILEDSSPADPRDALPSGRPVAGPCVVAQRRWISDISLLETGLRELPPQHRFWSAVQGRSSRGRRPVSDFRARRARAQPERTVAKLVCRSGLRSPEAGQTDSARSDVDATI